MVHFVTSQNFLKQKTNILSQFCWSLLEVEFFFKNNQQPGALFTGTRSWQEWFYTQQHVPWTLCKMCNHGTSVFLAVCLFCSKASSNAWEIQNFAPKLCEWVSRSWFRLIQTVMVIWSHHKTTWWTVDWNCTGVQEERNIKMSRIY